MPYFSAVITPPTAYFNAVSARVAQTPARMAQNFKGDVMPIAQRTVLTLRPEPPSGNTFGVTRLMTRRQARFVHAMRNARGGGDYGRTHGISNGWQQVVSAAAQGGSAEVFNDAPGVQYVQGDQQQPFLKALGWTYAPPILDNFAAQGLDATASAWHDASDPFGGIP